MDSKQNKNIRLYKSCDDLPLYNFEKAKKGDLKYLVWGYDGFGKVKKPKNISKIWEGLLEEYSSLVKNNQLFQYYELITDISYQTVRITIVSELLHQISTRANIKKELQKEYYKELRGWGFLFNESKPLESEIQRLYRQIKAAKMKLSQMIKEKRRQESKKKDKTPFLKIKTRVENHLKRHIDIRKTTVSEWVYIVEDIFNSKKKAA